MALPHSPELDHRRSLFLPGGSGPVCRKKAPQYDITSSSFQTVSTATRVFNRDELPLKNKMQPQLHHRSLDDKQIENEDDPESCVLRVRSLLERYERNLASAYSSLVPKEKQNLSLKEMSLTPEELSFGLISKYGISTKISETVAKLLDRVTNGCGIDLPTFCQEMCRTSSRLRDFHGCLDNGSLTPSSDVVETKGTGYHSKAAAHFSELNRSSLHMSTNLPINKSKTASPFEGDPAPSGANPSFINEHGFGYVDYDKVPQSTPHRPASHNYHTEDILQSRQSEYEDSSSSRQKSSQSSSKGMKYNPITHKGGRPEDKLHWFQGEQTSILKTRLQLHQQQGIDVHNTLPTTPTTNVTMTNSGMWLRATESPLPPH